MWPRWRTNNNNKSPSTAMVNHKKTHSSIFRFTTFKDIQSLLEDETFRPPQGAQGSQLYKKPNIFHRVRITNSILRSWSTPSQTKPLSVALPEWTKLLGSEDRIVIYTTSLRVVRKTFEDCKTVLTIFKCFLVKIDERDLSMDASFQGELQQVLGIGKGKRIGLPKVFIGGKYVGGVDEIRQLHETGELKKMVEGFEVGSGCECCGGYRFVLCEECNGSRKCYIDEKGGFKTCLVCNENGLIRCSTCS